MSKQNSQEKIKPLVEVVAGFSAGISTILITYPITKLIYRQILENQGPIKSLINIKREGMGILYRGVLPPMLHKGISISVMFSVYKTTNKFFKSTTLSPITQQFFSATLTGIVESLTTPLERVQTLLIHTKYNQEFKNTAHIFRIIAKDYPFKEYFRGFNIILFRNVTYTAVFFALKSGIHKVLKTEDKRKQYIINSFSGFLLGPTLTVILYPVKVIKVNQQKELGSEFRKIRDVSIEIYRKNNAGLVNFYRGLWSGITRSFFSWGITLFLYERFRKQINN